MINNQQLSSINSENLVCAHTTLYQCFKTRPGVDPAWPSGHGSIGLTGRTVGQPVY